MAELVAARGLSAAPYYCLAAGFLTGKYRPGGARVQSARAAERASGTSRTRAGRRCWRRWTRWPPRTRRRSRTVALAWLAAQPTVVAPIASARTVEQVPALAAAADWS